ncbi:MAG: outer membrane protein assembly factor BamB [Gammaproteobacteria bacterium]
MMLEPNNVQGRTNPAGGRFRHPALRDTSASMHVARRAGAGNMPVRGIAGVLLLALLGGGCSSIMTPDREPPPKLTVLEGGVPVHALWSTNFGAKLEGQYQRFAPIVEGGKLFVADGEGRVASLDAASGKTLWVVETKAKISAGLGSGEGLLLAGTRNAEVLALRKDDAAVAWRSPVSSEVLAPPRTAEGMVVARTVDDKVLALDAKNGNRLWMQGQTVPILTLRGTGAPLVSGDKVIVGFANGNLAAFSLADGKAVWEVRIAAPQGRSELEQMVDVDADPVIMDDVVYAVSFQGRLAAVALDTGRLLWARDMSSFNNIAMDKDKIYATDSEGQVWALDRTNGVALWKQDKLSGRGLTAPVIHGDYVVAGDIEGYLHWLARDDGHFVARYRVNDSAITITPVVAGDTLYVRGKNGALSAIAVPGAALGSPSP